MRSPQTVLETLRKHAQKAHYQYERLYRNLYNPQLYLLAYQNLYANKGSTTAGADGATLSGMSLKRIESLIKKLRDRSYQPHPARRQYIPKKSGNGLRPLGIPAADDKLVQEAVRMILESIYEPTFQSTSHGFRPGKSCHTALSQIQKTFTGVSWFVEGDIKGCYDHISHDWLIKHIPMDKSVLKQFLKAGFVFRDELFPTDAGTPQGGIISPILANLTLDGMQKVLSDHFDLSAKGEVSAFVHNKSKVNLVRYADDFIVTAATKEIAEELRRFKISADFYHAGLKSEDKNRKQQSWKEDHCRVIVATNAFGMGIDKPDVRLVIHLDLPNSPEEYYQEAGRAGRDGLQAYAVILYANADKVKLEKRIRDMFPEREFISRVYEALGNFLQVAVGSGMNSVFDFNLNTFCKTFKFPILPTFNALKILEQAQYIEFTEEVESLSRVMITVQRDELYKLQTDDSEKEELLQCLLRSYTGLFADYVFIQEDLLSRRSGISPQEVYENLIYFSKQHILHYIPQKRTPFIIYTTPREDLKYLSIPRNVYEERKERFSHRIHSMLEYVLHDKKCRTQILLNYFGETFNRECRLCDICLQQKSGELTSGDFSRIEKEIYKLLQADKCSLDTIIARIPFSQEKIVETLRFLCDEQFVQVKDGLYYI